MTLKLDDFFNKGYPHKAIHVNCQSEANRLLWAFDKMGKRHPTTSTFLTFKDDTCYSNDGNYSSIRNFNRSGVYVYEYSDFEDDINRILSKSMQKALPSITLSDFFDTKKNPRSYIHVTSDLDATHLTLAFHLLGKTWRSKESYVNHHIYEKNGWCCYSNDGYVENFNFASSMGKVIEYASVKDDVMRIIMEGIQDTPTSAIKFKTFDHDPTPNPCLAVIKPTDGKWSLRDYFANAGIRSYASNEKDRITTVVFKDGDVQMAKCSKDDHYDVKVGVALCVAYHAFGSKTKMAKYLGLNTPKDTSTPTPVMKKVTKPKKATKK